MLFSQSIDNIKNKQEKNYCCSILLYIRIIQALSINNIQYTKLLLF
jgi:hypothetical protein